MKNKFTLAVSVLLLAALLLACKFNSGGNTTVGSGSSNSASRSAPETADSNDPQDFRIEIKRSFTVSEKPEGPPRHGDYTIIRELENGGTLGSLYLLKPQEAVFILWDGEVLAGPLTTVEQLEEAYAELSRQSKAEHETRMDIIRRFPTGRDKRVRVYDKDGRLIREDN
jgi:hypothetical protein